MKINSKISSKINSKTYLKVNIKKFLTVLAVLAVFLNPIRAFACTEIYIGSHLTDDGSTVFGRLEEYYSDIGMSKLFDAVPSGVHKAGEEYLGCYGFKWTFTHDSYGYTAFCDDNSQGVCPDCEGTHEHTPYQAAGTNEKGLSVSATETLEGKETIASVDPFNTESGIEEAEIPTILLSEAATAREAMELLTGILSTTGACSAGSVIVADAGETWYIESLSGTQYAAVKLNEDLLFVCPNISIIGPVDLDDTEHIRASDKLIETAVRAGTFKGDADARIIDFAASYEEPYESTYLRLSAALNFLSSGHTWPAEMKAEDIDSADFRISNIDLKGNTVPPYTRIRADKKLSVRDAMELFRRPPISRRRSLETHLFQIKGSGKDDTVEWISMGDPQYSAFVPFLPMLTTDVFGPYRTGTEMPEFVEVKPAGGLYYATQYDLWGIYPEGWRNSFYWVFTALEHITREDKSAARHIADTMSALQDEICQKKMTGNAAAEKAYKTALELLKEYGM